MLRFVAVLALAVVGLVWLLLAPGVAMKVAGINAFVAAALCPVVMTPTRKWTQAFWRCFDTAYASALVAAVVVATHAHEPFVRSVASCVVPGLVFGTMASLGVSRSSFAR
jgi:hypothetical protein